MKPASKTSPAPVVSRASTGTRRLPVAGAEPGSMATAPAPPSFTTTMRPPAANLAGACSRVSQRVQASASAALGMNTSMAANVSASPDGAELLDVPGDVGEDERGKAVQAGQPLRIGVGQRDHEGVGLVPVGQEALQGDRRDLFVGHELALAGEGDRGRDRRGPASDRTE